jgi:hypothetical protein
LFAILPFALINGINALIIVLVYRVTFISKINKKLRFVVLYFTFITLMNKVE